MSIPSALKAFFRLKEKKNKDKQSSISNSLEESRVSSQYEDPGALESYIIPDDYNDLDRLHQQHWLLRHALQCDFVSPVKDMLLEGVIVLDSGCGAGHWTIEMAERFPKSNFVGVDCSSVFPDNIEPSNVEFAISNIANTIPSPNSHFHFVFQRLLVLGLTNEDWDSSLKEFYRVMKPGAYIEMTEPNLKNVKSKGPLLKELLDTFNLMLDSHDLVPGIATELEGRLKQAGFVNQKIKTFHFKMNHTDEAGNLFWNDFKYGFVNLRHVIAKIKPEWEDAQVYENFLEEVGEEAKDNKSLMPMYIYYAQKP